MSDEHTQLCYAAFALFKQFLMTAPIPSFMVPLVNGDCLIFQSRVIATLADIFGWTLLVDIHGGYDATALNRNVAVYGYPFANQDTTNEFLAKINNHYDAQLIADVQEACQFLSKVLYPLLGLSIDF